MTAQYTVYGVKEDCNGKEAKAPQARHIKERISATDADRVRDRAR